MLRRLALAALLALSPTLALAQVNSPDFSIAAYVRNALAGNVVIGGNLTVGGIIIDTSGGITVGSPTGGSQGTGTINVAVNYFKNGIATPSTVSLPLALAAGNISCPTCVLISGTAHGDSAYAILSTDRYVYTNASFTAARIWTLPAANSLAAGTTIWVQDAQGTVTTTNTLTVQRAGADTVNVTGTNIVMTGAGGGTQFTTDGVSNWGTAVQTVTTGGTGRQTLTNHGVIVGAATNPVTQLAVGANGTLLLGATGADPAFGAMSQDCTITAAGVITCTKTNNVAFGALATATPGTGVATAIGVNVGTAGAFVVNGGALGTPSSGVGTNLTGTASGLTAGNVTTNANLTGPVTSAGNATSVTANAITNAMRAQMAAHTVRGNNTASTANTADLTIPQLVAQFTTPTTQTFLSGSATYTTPANVTWIEVWVVGGGGGGAGSGTAPGAPGAGVASTFGSSLLTANGGAAGLSNGASAAGGAATGGDDNLTGGSGGQAGTPNNSTGGIGGSNPRGGAGLSGPAQVGLAAVANTGGGGGGGGEITTSLSGGGGGAGAWLRKIIGAPNATYAYVVGGGGAAGTAGTGGVAGGAGGSGFIQVVEHYN